MLARVRVEKVKNLLQNPRLQITAIAYDTGFQSLSQFNRVYKQVTGTTPRAYRAGLAGAAQPKICAIVPAECGVSAVRM